MKKQQQSNLRRILMEPGTTPSRPIHQIVDGSLLTLEITQVHPYDRNPRKGKNPKYDDIKASIRVRGIEQMIKVTQRPGMRHDQFMVSGGGNTRLAILHELYEETDNPRFLTNQFIYEAWESESRNLIAHLIENNERGELTLIDKALAIFDARSLLEEESGDNFTNRKLTDALKTAGLASVHRREINTYEFAVETLYPVIPDLLDQGLGRRQINQISKLMNAAHEVWAHHNADEADEFQSLFPALLARQNHADLSDGWQEQLHADIVRELAQGDRKEFEKIRLQLEHLLKHGRLLTVDKEAMGSPVPPVSSAAKEKPKTISQPAPAQKENPKEDLAPPKQSTPTNPEPSATGHPNDRPSDSPGQQSPCAPEATLAFKPGTLQADYFVQQQKITADQAAIDQIRSRLFDHAFELAQLTFSDPDDAHCIVSIDNGAGFFIQEFPALANSDEKPIYSEIKISRQVHNDHLTIRSANALDFLLNVAEQFSSTATAVIEHTNLYPENTLLATYHYSTLGLSEAAKSEPATLQTWRSLLENRRHNSLSFSYYNLSRDESAIVNQLMTDLLDDYHELTVVHHIQTGGFPLWTMEAQS